MDEALDFILDSTKIGNGSEIFVPKMRAYSILDLKQALVELLGDTGEEKIPIRPGEKIHEILINRDEMRSVWETESKYSLLSPEITENELKNRYPGWRKIDTETPYSSENVDKIPVEELKSILVSSGIVEK